MSVIERVTKDFARIVSDEQLIRGFRSKLVITLRSNKWR